MPSKKPVKKLSKKIDKSDLVVNEVMVKINPVIMDLKNSLQDAVQTIRNDLAADVAEQISKIKIPEPAIESKPADMGAIKDLLKDGNIDLSKIGSLMGNIPSQTSMPPADIGKMSPQQMDFMKHQQMMELIGRIAPAVIAGQNQSNPMMAELMQRIFMEKISSSLYMDRAMINMMAKKAGLPDPVVVTPATAVIPTQVPTSTPVNGLMGSGQPQ